jgi:hypothetical protein
MEHTLEDWQELILEQYDQSWKKPHRCKARVVEKIVRIGQADEGLLKLYYHAGRFAGGARDRLACDSYRELQRDGRL